ncbi:MAG TPA: IS3 family transposase [Candidatus Omnitrophota bacterium]|nr:IS3 family transposase [Candidatus Omnitrophota bacterium]
MKRAKSQSVTRRNQKLLDQIKQIKTDHPLWGYRRIWSYLKYRQGMAVNKKRIYRLMKEQNLIVTPQARLKAKRGPMRPKPVASRPNQFWGIDMTKIKLYGWGWLYLCVVLDWHSKEIVGHALSLQSKTDHWLDALQMAVNDRFPDGIREALKEQKLFLISDNGCQPTSQRFMMNCSILGLKQIFTTWSNPKGNSDTERVMRTIKEDIVWPYDWENPFEFEVRLAQWIHDYNTDFPHQSLDNLTPAQFYEKCQLNKEPILT